MSVINSVLKDLDERPTVFTPLGAAAARDKEPGKGGSTPVWALSVLLLVTAGLLLWFIYSARYSSASIAGASNSLAGAPVELPAESIGTIDPLKTPSEPGSNLAGEGVPVAPVNQITGLQIRENEQFMELEFQLAYAASIYLKQRANNRYLFLMRDVASSITPPLISDNPWIEQIAIESQGNDLEIRFDTQAGVLVDTEEQRGDALYHWLIRLKTPPGKSKIDSNLALSPAKESPASRDPAPQKLVARVSSVATGRNKTASRSEVSAPAETDKQRTVVQKPVKLEINPSSSAKADDRDLLRQALASINQGDTASGLEMLNQLRGGKFDRDVRIHQLRIYQTLNEAPRFNALLQESLTLYPADPVFQLYRANGLFAAKRYADLINLYGSEQSQGDLINLVAAAYQRLGRHREAMVSYQRALEVDPAQPRLWISLGISQQHLKLREQALESYQMALRSGALNQRLREYVGDQIRQLSN